MHKDNGKKQVLGHGRGIYKLGDGEELGRSLGRGSNRQGQLGILKLLQQKEPMAIREAITNIWNQEDSGGDVLLTPIVKGFPMTLAMIVHIFIEVTSNTLPCFPPRHVFISHTPSILFFLLTTFHPLFPYPSSYSYNWSLPTPKI